MSRAVADEHDAQEPQRRAVVVLEKADQYSPACRQRPGLGLAEAASWTGFVLVHAPGGCQSPVIKTQTRGHPEQICPAAWGRRKSPQFFQNPSLGTTTALLWRRGGQQPLGHTGLSTAPAPCRRPSWRSPAVLGNHTNIQGAAASHQVRRGGFSHLGLGVGAPYGALLGSGNVLELGKAPGGPSGGMPMAAPPPLQCRCRSSAVPSSCLLACTRIS